MKVLVIGSGGREHALAWKLAQSNEVSQIFAAPGNGGTASENKCSNVPLSTSDQSSLSSPQAIDCLLDFARKERIELTVVGPESPLAAGIVNRFRAEGLFIIGPDEKAARLEASKVFSKSFMEKYGVRAGRSRNFSEYEAARHYTESFFSQNDSPLVIKADGLAAGKGVVIAKNVKEATEALTLFMLEKSLGSAGTNIILEEFLEGREVSIMAAVSVMPGKTGFITPFIPARDHKRRFDGGQGPNTGGMGAIAPVPDFSETAARDFESAILEPTLKGMEAEAMDYRGFIFFGLMVHNSRCFLLEYNVRLGDPETQALLPLMDSDLSALCSSILNGKLKDFRLTWKDGAVCAPVAVADGYPGQYSKGNPIAIDKAGLEKTGARVFFAGAVSADAGLATSGGRVLAVSAHGRDGGEAREKAYQAMNAVHFTGMAYRRDIGL